MGTVAMHFAPPSSMPRAAVGYSPASFFALSLLLIYRSLRITLHTLHAPSVKFLALGRHRDKCR